MALRCMMPEYTISEARQKLCSCTAFLVTSYGKYGRGTRNCFKSGSSLCHLLQAVSIFSGTGSSQVKLCSHNHWNSIFISTIVGEHYSKTSNKRVMFNASTRFVKGSLISVVDITGQKQSDTTLDSTPRTLVYSS